MFAAHGEGTPTLKRLLTVVAVLSVTGAFTAASAGAAEPYGHAGRWITDAQGRVVTFHGFNMVNKIRASGYLPDAIGFGADDARFLAANGFNVVRLGIIWKGLEPQPGVYDEAYLNRIMRTYKLLHTYGISVLLDFHQDMYNERFQGEGAPDWAIVGPAATENPSPQAGFPFNYVLQDAVNHAYDAFWANTQVPGTGRGVQDLYAAAWAPGRRGSGPSIARPTLSASSTRRAPPTRARGSGRGRSRSSASPPFNTWGDIKSGFAAHGSYPARAPGSCGSRSAVTQRQ